MKRPLVAVVCAAWSLFAASQNEPPMSAERIERERVDIEATQKTQNALFSELERACEGKFAVNDCLSAVQSKRRVVMTALKRREADLNDMQRKARNFEQTRRSAEKAADAASRRAEMDTQAQSSAPTDRQAAQKEKVRSHPQPIPTGDRPKTIKSPSVRNDTELAQNREAYANKQKAALQKQVERDKRLKEGGAARLGLPKTD